MTGWFAMNRAMFEHPIFEGQPLRVAAWAWMLATAAWKDTSQNVNGKRVTVRRGQLLTSLRQMSKATGVPVQPLRTLLDKLTEQTAINTDTSHGRLLITICNYDKYQASDSPANTGSNTAPTQQQHTKEQDKQILPSEDASASAEIVALESDAAKVWRDGKAYLSQHNINPKHAGSIIGKWRSANDDEQILKAIAAAEKAGTQDPIPYITKTLANGDGTKLDRAGENRNYAEAIRRGICPRSLSAHRARELVENNFVTEEQCRKVGAPLNASQTS